MIVAGEKVPTGASIVTWRDAAGYDGYAGGPGLPRAPAGVSNGAPPIRDRAALRGIVDQIVLHYDACGLSRLCFAALRARGLSVHFLVDADGTVYQTLDVREKALHATAANDRSIGIEIANIGAYPPADAAVLEEWYWRDATGETVLRVPPDLGAAGFRVPGFVGRPARPEPVRGVVQGRELVQYDFTREQYAALVRLVAALCREFPLVRCEYPREPDGRVVTHKLGDAELLRYRGLLGHCHVQNNKVDPGPAFAWPEFVAAVRKQIAANR